MASQISTTVLPTDLYVTTNRTTRRAHWRKLHLTPLSAADLLQPQSSSSMCCCCHWKVNYQAGSQVLSLVLQPVNFCRHLCLPLKPTLKPSRPVLSLCTGKSRYHLARSPHATLISALSQRAASTHCRGGIPPLPRAGRDMWKLRERIAAAPPAGEPTAVLAAASALTPVRAESITLPCILDVDKLPP